MALFTTIILTILAVCLAQHPEPLAGYFPEDGEASADFRSASIPNGFSRFSGSSNPWLDGSSPPYRGRSDSRHKDNKPMRAEGRFLFTTYTLTLTTTTTFSTSITTSTCTTSTATLSTCTAGRRRKSGSSAPDPHSPKLRGLFYNEDDEYEESIFLPVTPQPEEKKVENTEMSIELSGLRPSTETLLVGPMTSSDTRSLIDSLLGSRGRDPRFFFTYFTFSFKPSTITTTSISTVTLIATCSSSSSFQLCGSTG